MVRCLSIVRPRWLPTFHDASAAKGVASPKMGYGESQVAGLTLYPRNHSKGRGTLASLNATSAVGPDITPPSCEAREGRQHAPVRFARIASYRNHRATLVQRPAQGLRRR